MKPPGVALALLVTAGCQANRPTPLPAVVRVALAASLGFDSAGLAAVASYVAWQVDSAYPGAVVAVGRRADDLEAVATETGAVPKVADATDGAQIDAAVAQTFLEAMQPAQLEISLAAIEQLEARQRQIEGQWQLRIERAQ